MSAGPSSPSDTSSPRAGATGDGERKLLPGATPAPGPVPADPVPAASHPRQLSELPKDELEHLVEEFGLDATRYKSRQTLVVALHDRRQMIAGMDRDAMLDVIRWGRRPVTRTASK